jgi:hypothetical protein
MKVAQREGTLGPPAMGSGHRDVVLEPRVQSQLVLGTGGAKTGGDERWQRWIPYRLQAIR